MNLKYSFSDISRILGKKNSADPSLIKAISFDSRKIISGKNILFFALKGTFRDGHDYIESSYNKGVRFFVVSKPNLLDSFPEAQGILVEDTLSALLKLAKHHRDEFNFPIIAITGSNGKTTTKEWLSKLLSCKFQVTRSPKSYNSAIGIAMSILEFNEETNIGIIEVGVSSLNDMKNVREVIKPTHGIITSFGSAHRELFKSASDHLSAKLEIFKDVENLFYPEILKLEKGIVVKQDSNKEIIKHFKLAGDFNKMNAQMAITVALFFGVKSNELKKIVPYISPLALRLETFRGTNNNTIINDTYSLDIESLRDSLEYQLFVSKENKRYAIIGLLDSKNENKYKLLLDKFNLNQYFFYYKGEKINYKFENSNVLIKGSRKLRMELLANKFKEKNHQTYLEINTKAIRNNINYLKSLLNTETKILCMVKASSYGSDSKTMGHFLQKTGIDYLGVAYSDEGIELRKNGIKKPILVMNAEEKTFADCIEYNLEPAIFSIKQLESLIKELIAQGYSNFPIHIKIETGMNRLGFDKSNIQELIDIIKTQPEVIIKSIYSHLAESNIVDSIFTEKQINSFNNISMFIMNNFSYKIDRHILNSEGVKNYSKAQFEMVRLGIGMYGVCGSENMQPAIAWLSSISQIKKITPSESIGYNRTFVAKKNMTIAIIPVGYADGFKRILGRGNGGVFIQNKYCPTLGEVCMDMIIVDITGIDIEEGETVEIIGKNQTINSFSKKASTIPYEIMTSFSQRLHRIYID